ncbi:MAG: ACT domain-containing protein [Candidatus Omnitrophica bacterium]|nr:ACT domain-containing protein [Candidatus Omnitrophota bacterium]
MVKTADLGKEIVVTVINKVGVLADMSRILADHGVNIEAVAGYTVDSRATIMLVTSDNLRAIEALQKGGYKSAKQNDVIIAVLENKTGALKSVSSRLSLEGVDIKYIYGTACPSQCPARIVMSTTDNEKALVVLKAKQG